jgi:Lysylphosphatidylglycerol synthase TM region
MKALRAALLLGGVATLTVLVVRIGAGPLVASLSRLAWWQFLLVCLPVGLGMAVDTLGWRYVFAGEPPPYARMLAARITGHSLNVVTALGSVGGEAVKVWLLRPVVPYDESVPSVVLDKTAITIAQTLFLLLGLVIAEVTGAGDRRIIEPVMLGLVAVEVLAVGGFFLTQIAGLVGRAGRLLARAGLIRHPSDAERLDARLRRFYRHQWPRFLLAVAFHLGGFLTDVVGTVVILRVLRIPVGLATAAVIEALGSGVQFATFFIPGSLGVLEGANAATFGILGLGASAGLAFSLVRRAREAVWIGVGVLVLVVVRAQAARVATAPRHALRSPSWLGERS